MIRPNFFILGAPRCGTTALFSYLSEHPNIYLPRYKELHYFAQELKDLWKFPYNTEDEYLALFKDAPAEAIAIGEAASLYFYSPTAAQRIYDFDPNARLIISLRNPADFVYSYHQLNLTMRRETVEDFETAWDLYEERKAGRAHTPGSRVPLITWYKELGCFGDQLERVYQIFPREQVKVVLVDDIKADMRKLYCELEAFLCVPDDGRSDFPQVNANYTYSSKLAQKLLHPSGGFYRAYTKISAHFPTRMIEGIAVLQKKVADVFTKPVKRDPLHPEIYNKVVDYYQPDLEKLSKLLDRDLSHWMMKKN